MLRRTSQDGPSPKCYFASSILPTFVNHDQLPAKKKPFSTISNHQFNHTVTLVTGQDDANDPTKSITKEIETFHYAKVYMKLIDLVEGGFFNRYIKAGNILMLSEGRPGIDHIFSLSEGILRLEVDKPTYERMGLDGVVVPHSGRNHVKARYAIELNLRLPSMVRGKKGFERVLWAFKNVLYHTATWLFYDLNGPTDGTRTIGAHCPKVKQVEPEITTLQGVKVPGFPQDIQEGDYAQATELLEWLSLATANSPRIRADDDIDSYLSRYRVGLEEESFTDMTTSSPQNVATLRWHAFIPSTFVKDVFLAALKASGSKWFGMSVNAFDGRAYSILQHDHRTMTWEYMN